jgi:hypothetical protein
VRTVAVVVGNPHRNLRPGVVKIEEQGLVEQFIAHATVEALEGILDRLAWRDEVPVDAGVLAPSQHGITGELGAIVETIEPGLPRRSTIMANSRATRRPKIDVSGIAPRHSLVTSPTMLRTRRRRPLAN